MLGYLQVDDKGVTLTTGPGNYKIPLISDIPSQFNTALLKNSLNDEGVYSSKVSQLQPFHYVTDFPVCNFQTVTLGFVIC